MLRWMFLVFAVFLTSCGLGTKRDLPDVDDNYVLDYKIVALAVNFSPNARIIGLPGDTPEEIAENKAALEAALQEEMEKRLLPQYRGSKPAVLQVELVRLVLRNAKEAVATDLRNQLFGNVYFADVETQELITQSGVRVFDFNFKADGNIGVLITATANNKRSFKRRFSQMARDFTERAALILK
ncbi:MAG: hypothetical protein AAF429_00300 [Pseudomonadota bacterium]